MEQEPNEQEPNEATEIVGGKVETVEVSRHLLRHGDPVHSLLLQYIFL